MSKKINTTSIGLFIVAGVALGVAGLLLFSSSKMFSRTHEQILYFDGSLNGLHDGASVKYRGVTIGTVKRVMVRFNQAANDNAMPVLIELEDKLVRQRLGDAAGELYYSNAMEERTREERIKAGLRATLQTESLVTGLLYVNLEVDPNAPPPVFHQLEKIYPELPTEPTKIQQLFSNLASFDIKSIGKNLNALLSKLDATVSNLNVAEITASITNDLASVRVTLDQYRLLAEKLNGRIDPLADSVTNTLAEADRALAQIRGAAQNLRTLIAPDAPLPNDLDQALHQLSGAVQSLSVLLDFLKQHPNAIITGRETIQEKLENKP
jgi:paraquat-inducible protein B